MDVQKVLETIRRDLGADAVFVSDEESLGRSGLVVSVPLGSKTLCAVFSDTGISLEIVREKLTVFADTFRAALVAGAERKHSDARIANQHALHVELTRVKDLASASDVLVLDALAPVVWGCASQLFTPGEEYALNESHNVVELFPKAQKPEENLATTPLDLLSDWLAELHADPRWHAISRGERTGWWFESTSVAWIHPFAVTYALVVKGVEREQSLAVHRAVAGSDARIERLVLAMVPVPDPEGPQAGVARRPGRRR